MASGRLGAADLAANTDTAAYTVPAAKTASFTVSLCNRSAVAVTARIALSTTATPTATDYVEYDAVIPPNGVLERSGLVLAATQVCVVRSSGASVSAVVFGFEE